MQDQENTPSVDFHFEDAPSSKSRRSHPQEETEVKYELSCTNDKKITAFYHTTVSPTPHICHRITFNEHSSSDEINSEEFFQNFESRYVVTFERDSQQYTVLSNEKAGEEIENKENSLLSENKINLAFQPIRLSFPARIDQQSYGEYQCKMKEFKSQIISNKKKSHLHPLFAFKKKKQLEKILPQQQEAKSDRISKKKGECDLLSKLNFPQTCRHFEGVLSLTSKALDINSEPNSKFCPKMKKRRSPSLKANSFLEKTNSSEDSGLLVKGKIKPFTKIKQEKKVLSKSNIFVRLPSLR